MRRFLSRLDDAAWTVGLVLGVGLLYLALAFFVPAHEFDRWLWGSD